MQQLEPLYDAAAGVPAAVDVKPLLDALRGSQWWTGSALDLAGHGQKDAAEFLEKLLEVMHAELRHGQHPQLLSQRYCGRRVGATVCDCCAQARWQTLLYALGASKDVVVFHQITIPALTRADPPVTVSCIEQGLLEAFQPERMDGDNCYECAVCESYQFA